MWNIQVNTHTHNYIGKHTHTYDHSHPCTGTHPPPINSNPKFLNDEGTPTNTALINSYRTSCHHSMDGCKHSINFCNPNYDIDMCDGHDVFTVCLQLVLEHFPPLRKIVNVYVESNRFQFARTPRFNDY